MTELQAINTALAEAVNDRIEELEAAMLECEQVEIPVEHLFINGMYARKIVIPADTMLTGRVHKFGYVDIMLSGDISVATPDGVKRMTGYNILEGKPGRKRAGYAHEDTHWVTVHRTNETDPDGIEDKLTFFSMQEFNNFLIQRDQVDYKEILAEIGMSQDEVNEQVLQDDMVALPGEFIDRVTLGESLIHGKGLFAATLLKSGTVIPARLDNKRTVGGRYVNHSTRPNAKMMLLNNGDVDLVAIHDIQAGTEITTDYRETIKEVWRG